MVQSAREPSENDDQLRSSFYFNIYPGYSHFYNNVINDEEVNELRKKVSFIVKDIDEEFSMHDFRIVRAINYTNLIFEVAVPFGAGVIETPLGNLYSSVFDFEGVISKRSDIVYLDADKLKVPLALRNIKNGDRFQPFGMRGTKLVSDYLTDKKRSIIEKRDQLVVVDADGMVVWLVGERPAAPFCNGKSTKRILSLEWLFSISFCQ